MKLIARWAPQEVPAGGVEPGENLFPIDPADPTTSNWYLWHCHVLGHEDNDMMRKLPMVNLWRANRSYVAGTVVTHDNINYRIRAAHTSRSTQPPPSRFDRYERVNNNDGTWVPQIIYAIGDRVLHNGALYKALEIHQAQTGQPPPNNPQLWEAFPSTACAQLQNLCADNTSPAALTCQTLGAAANEPACLTGLAGCLAQCDDYV
jgi:hypothetical protein